jgi:amidase
MAFADELSFAPARKLIAMLHAREVSSTELTRAAYERIRRINPKLNAVVTLCEERALKEAAESDRRLGARSDIRRLEGLPITIKDTIASEGVRSTDGMRILEHNVPERDAPTVARYRRAGAVMLGKTNIPEMAMDYDCENPVFGATNNPWNPGRVPGGSSGGEAAALAAGLCASGWVRTMAVLSECRRISPASSGSSRRGGRFQAPDICSARTTPSHPGRRRSRIWRRSGRWRGTLMI